MLVPNSGIATRNGIVAPRVIADAGDQDIAGNVGGTNPKVCRTDNGRGRGGVVSFGFKGVSDKAIGRINQNVSALREICFYLSTRYCTTP